MANTLIRDRQTVLDMAIQHSGSVEAAFDICQKNDISITGALQTASFLKIERVQNDYVTKIFKTDEIIPVSRYADEIYKGIGFWMVDIDFKIS